MSEVDLEYTCWSMDFTYEMYVEYMKLYKKMHQGIVTEEEYLNKCSQFDKQF